MSSDIAISVKNISKCYPIYDRPQDRLKQSILRRRRYFREFWALKDVSFEVKKGETVGIIGRNGSGKSTLLQIIAGTLTPTAGEVQVNGRVAALLELGSGFNPEFTGRENVYMNGAVIGLSKEEIDARFDDIVAFADIGDFIEQPVKTYSSGMFVRLAFAINIMSQPEIMIVDEALAVGDMSFQAKCMTALKRIQESGATVVFVSHDIGAVKSLCSRGIHLEQGELKNVGIATNVAENYIRMMREEMNEEQRRFMRSSTTFPVVEEKTDSTLSETQVGGFKESDDFERRVEQFRYGSGSARITYVELLNNDDKPIDFVEFNQEVRIRIYFKSYSNLYISPNYYILDDKKNLILGAGPRILGKPLINAKKNTRYVVTYTTTLPLQEGIYSIQLQLTSPVILDETAEFLDVIDDAIVFNVARKRDGRVWAKVFLPNSYGCTEI